MMSSKTKPNNTNVIGQIYQHEKQVIYTWSIDDFCNIRKQYSPEKAIWSPIFYTDVKSLWQLQLYPQGNVDLNVEEYISIYAYNLSKTTIKAQITYFIMDGAQELCQTKAEYHEYEYGKSWGHSKYLKYNDISAKLLANNNKLIIKCKVELDSKSCTELHKNETQIHFQIQKYYDFEKLLNNSMFSDVILIAEGEKIHAHKNILAVGCAVFAAMFEHHMAENEQNVVEIKDISSNVLKEMLRYIYVGKVNNIIGMANDLLVAADKYLLQNLKNMCENTLSDDLSPSNAIKYLDLADNHNAPKLKAEAIQYIVSNAETIINDPEFQSYGELDSSLICEVFQKLVRQRVDEKAK